MSGQDGLGMFGCKGVTGATIKNLVIEDAAVTGTHIYYAGVLVGDFHDGTIENITIRNVGVAGYKWVGAVAGQTVNSTLKNITVEGATVKATGDSRAGGVVGAWRFESTRMRVRQRIWSCLTALSRRSQNRPAAFSEMLTAE